MKPIIFLDIDGVLANFVEGACQLHGIDPNFPNRKFWKPDPSDKQFWSRINSRGYAFWEDLPKYSWADQLLGICQEHADRVSFCSSVDPRGSAAAQGKYEWLFKHFGYKRAARAVITRKKFLLAGPNRILIDDSYDQLNRFYQWGGRSIMFPQPWNRVWEPGFSKGGRISYIRKRIKRHTKKVYDKS